MRVPHRSGLRKAGCSLGLGWAGDQCSTSVCQSGLQTPLSHRVSPLWVWHSTVWMSGKIMARSTISSSPAPALLDPYLPFFLLLISPCCLHAAPWRTLRLSQPLSPAVKQWTKWTKKGRAEICSWILILLLAGDRELASESRWHWHFPAAQVLNWGF